VADGVPAETPRGQTDGAACSTSGYLTAKGVYAVDERAFGDLMLRERAVWRVTPIVVNRRYVAQCVAARVRFHLFREFGCSTNDMSSMNDATHARGVRIFLQRHRREHLWHEGQRYRLQLEYPVYNPVKFAIMAKNLGSCGSYTSPSG